MLRKILVNSPILVLLLASCAIAAERQTKLPDGFYKFVALDASDNEIGRPININVPFNDPRMAIFALCSGREGAVGVAAKNDEGAIVAQTRCGEQKM